MTKLMDRHDGSPLWYIAMEASLFISQCKMNRLGSTP